MISIIVILSKIILSPFVLCSQDLLVGFDFAPLVFFNEDINSLEVDMSLVHDVKEQAYGTGEDVGTSFRNRSTTLLTKNLRDNDKLSQNEDRKSLSTSCEF